VACVEGKDAQFTQVCDCDCLIVRITKPCEGEIRILKVDDTVPPELLPGATFKIEPNPYPGSPNYPDFLEVTDGGTYDKANGDDGEILLTEVPCGTYTVTEIVAPTGYILDPTPQEVVVASISAITFVNYPDECELTVTKTAEPFKTKTYEWGIWKWATDDTIKLDEGATKDVTYKVKVDRIGYTYSAVKVRGTITIYNPCPCEVEVCVTDTIFDTWPDPDPGHHHGTQDLGCHTIAAGETLELPYEIELQGSQPLGALCDPECYVNVARVEVVSGPCLGPDPASIQYIATAEFCKGDATIERIDECIDVEDTHEGFLGTVCYNDSLPKYFTYTRTVGPYECDGATGGTEALTWDWCDWCCEYCEYWVDNTATFTTKDTGTTGSDTETVYIKVCKIE
jgi:hypothetical protein